MAGMKFFDTRLIKNSWTLQIWEKNIFETKIFVVGLNDFTSQLIKKSEKIEQKLFPCFCDLPVWLLCFQSGQAYAVFWSSRKSQKFYDVILRLIGEFVFEAKISAAFEGADSSTILLPNTFDWWLTFNSALGSAHEWIRCRNWFRLSLIHTGAAKLMTQGKKYALVQICKCVLIFRGNRCLRLFLINN